MVERSPHILVTTEEIQTFLGIKKESFYKLIEAGLPAAKIGNCLVAHTENVEEFIKRLTKFPVKYLPKETAEEIP